MTETKLQTAETPTEPEPEPTPGEPEPTEPEPTEPEPTEPEREPEAAAVKRVRNLNDPAKAERQLRRQIKDERDRHADRLGAILGDAADTTLPCPFCFDGLMGYVLHFDAGSLADEQKAAALAFISGDTGSPLNKAEGVEECPRCNGWGKLDYPTKVEHTREQTCPRCQGSGYVTSTPEAPPVTAFTLPPPAAVAQPNGSIGPCPLCGAPGQAGQPHWCQPVAAPVA